MILFWACAAVLMSLFVLFFNFMVHAKRGNFLSMSSTVNGVNEAWLKRLHEFRKSSDDGSIQLMGLSDLKFKSEEITGTELFETAVLE